MVNILSPTRSAAAEMTWLRQPRVFGFLCKLYMLQVLRCNTDFGISSSKQRRVMLYPWGSLP